MVGESSGGANGGAAQVEMFGTGVPPPDTIFMAPGAVGGGVPKA